MGSWDGSCEFSGFHSVTMKHRGAALNDNPGVWTDKVATTVSLRVGVVHPFELVVGAAFHAYFNDLSARKNISPHHTELGFARAPSIRTRLRGVNTEVA